MNLIRHAIVCKCSQCMSRVSDEPNVQYTFYSTRANIISIASIEYNGSSWLVNYTVAPLYKVNNEDEIQHGTWTLDMWNKYSMRWHDGEGK